MHEVLVRAFEPVLRDLRSAAITPVRIEDSDWSGDPDRPAAMLWGSHGGQGVAVATALSDVERTVSVADQVQEWAIEELWARGASTSWPACPSHPARHPMLALVSGGEAWWGCPADRTTVTPIGALSCPASTHRHGRTRAGRRTAR
jgi:hypothetical protein